MNPALFFLCVLCVSSLELLPAGVTINKVKKIEVNSAVEFQQSTDGTSTYVHRLAKDPSVKFDQAKGVLTIGTSSKSGASSTGVDVTVRVPGCFHVEGASNNILVFDANCMTVKLVAFEAPEQPIPATNEKKEWKPVNPATFVEAMDSLSSDAQYEVWRNNFGRRKDPTEKQNFVAFMKEVKAQNSKSNRQWVAGANQFSYLSNTEWKRKVIANNAAYLSAAKAGRRLLSEEELFSNITDSQKRRLLQAQSFTWLGTGKLTPVKDQGQCGSCYVHATSSQMEAHLAIATNSAPVVLAREQLKACSTGCAGGSPRNTYSMAASPGLTTEALYPYVAVDAPCRNPMPTIAYKNTGFKSIANNELAFKAALAIAPVAVTVCSGTTGWYTYKGGVFNCANSASCSVDHSVLLVGYGTDAVLGDYWLVQNSWATWWGEAGFIRLKRFDSSTQNAGTCGMTRYEGLQANTPISTLSAATPCVGSWSDWGTCSADCGTGTQYRFWTTTAQPTNGGAPCPNPTTLSQTCNTQTCDMPTVPETPEPTPRPTPEPTPRPTPQPTPTPTPEPASAPAVALPCALRVTNTAVKWGDGDYKQGSNWSQGCGSGSPQYTLTSGKGGGRFSLFFSATACVNNEHTAGKWCLSNYAGGTAYQCSNVLAISNGVIPHPSTFGGWYLGITSSSIC